MKNYSSTIFNMQNIARENKILIVNLLPDEFNKEYDNSVEIAKILKNHCNIESSIWYFYKEINQGLLEKEQIYKVALQKCSENIGVILTGSPLSVLDISQELFEITNQLISGCVESKTPLFSICFAAHALVIFFEGRDAVKDLNDNIFGIEDVGISNHDILLSSIPSKIKTVALHGRYFSFTDDDYTSKIEEIAWSITKGKRISQGFRVKGLDIWGVQFHLDFAASTNILHNLFVDDDKFQQTCHEYFIANKLADNQINYNIRIFKNFVKFCFDKYNLSEEIESYPVSHPTYYKIIVPDNAEIVNFGNFLKINKTIFGIDLLIQVILDNQNDALKIECEVSKIIDYYNKLLSKWDLSFIFLVCKKKIVELPTEIKEIFINLAVLTVNHPEFNPLYSANPLLFQQLMFDIRTLFGADNKNLKISEIISNNQLTEILLDFFAKLYDDDLLLDLSGMIKGLIVDKIATSCLKNNYYINYGGEIRSEGSLLNRAFYSSIYDHKLVELHDSKITALASSNITNQNVTANGTIIGVTIKLNLMKTSKKLLPYYLVFVNNLATYADIVSTVVLTLNNSRDAALYLTNLAKELDFIEVDFWLKDSDYYYNTHYQDKSSAMMNLFKESLRLISFFPRITYVLIVKDTNYSTALTSLIITDDKVSIGLLKETNIYQFIKNNPNKFPIAISINILMADQVDLLDLFSNPSSDIEQKNKFIEDGILLNSYKSFECKVTQLIDEVGIIEAKIIKQPEGSDHYSWYRPLYYAKNSYLEYLYKPMLDDVEHDITKDCVVYAPGRIMISKSEYSKYVDKVNSDKVKICYKNLTLSVASNDYYSSNDQLNKILQHFVFPQNKEMKADFIVNCKKIAELENVIILDILHFSDPLKLDYRQIININFCSASNYIGKSAFLSNYSISQKNDFEFYQKQYSGEVNILTNDYIIDANKLRTREPSIGLLFFAKLIKDNISQIINITEQNKEDFILKIPSNFSKILLYQGILTNKLPILSYYEMACSGIKLNELDLIVDKGIVDIIDELEKKHTQFIHSLIGHTNNNIQQIATFFDDIEHTYGLIIDHLSKCGSDNMSLDFLIHAGFLPTKIHFFNDESYQLLLDKYIIPTIFPGHIIYLLHIFITKFFDLLPEDLQDDVASIGGCDFIKYSKHSLNDIYLLKEHKTFITNIKINQDLKDIILDFAIRLLISNIKVGLSLRKLNIDTVFPSKHIMLLYVNLVHYINIITVNSTRAKYIALLTLLVKELVDI